MIAAVHSLAIVVGRATPGALRALPVTGFFRREKWNNKKCSTKASTAFKLSQSLYFTSWQQIFNWKTAKDQRMRRKWWGNEADFRVARELNNNNQPFLNHNDCFSSHEIHHTSLLGALKQDCGLFCLKKSNGSSKSCDGKTQFLPRRIVHRFKKTIIKHFAWKTTSSPLQNGFDTSGRMGDYFRMPKCFIVVYNNSKWCHSPFSRWLPREITALHRDFCRTFLVVKQLQSLFYMSQVASGI